MKSIKLKAFEILTGNPDITGADLAKRLGVVDRTAYRYKHEFEAMIDTTNKKIAEKIVESTENGGGIWLIIKKALKIK